MGTGQNGPALHIGDTLVFLLVNNCLEVRIFEAIVSEEGNVKCCRSISLVCKTMRV